MRNGFLLVAAWVGMAWGCGSAPVETLDASPGDPADAASAPDGAERPLVRGAPLDHLREMKSDGERLFALAGHWDAPTRVLSIEVPENRATQLAVLPDDSPRWLSVHGDHLYFVVWSGQEEGVDYPESLVRLPRTGGEMEVIVEDQRLDSYTYAASYVIDGDDLWYYRMIDLYDFELVHRSISAGTETVVSTSQAGPIAVDDDAIWVGGRYTEEDVLLRRFDRASGTETTVARSADVGVVAPARLRTWKILHDENAVYWVGEYDNWYPGSPDPLVATMVVRIDKATLEATQLALLPIAGASVEDDSEYDVSDVDETFVYYFQEPEYGDCGDGDHCTVVDCCPPARSKLYALSIADGTKVLLADAPASLAHARPLGDRLYYVDETPYPSEYEQRKLVSIARPTL